MPNNTAANSVSPNNTVPDHTLPNHTLPNHTVPNHTVQIDMNHQQVADHSSAVGHPRTSFSRQLAATLMLARREWVRFFRQRNRVIGAIGQPIMFWLLFGTGMHGAFRGGEGGFMTYYLPGTMALIILFTAIFTTISVIEDRKEGFLQNVLVAPVPRWTIAVGKILGGGVIAWVQAMLFLALTLAFGMVPLDYALLGAMALLLLGAFSLTAVGTCFAWPMESTQGFHAVMTLILMPAWLLSGAFFPIPAPAADSGIGQTVMHWIMRANPISYIVAGLRRMLGGVGNTAEFWLPSLSVCWLVTIAFTVVITALAVAIVRRPMQGDNR